MSDLNEYSDEAICQELFERIEAIRLEKNLTQQSLADELDITTKTYRNIATGKTRLQVLIGVLRILDRLDVIENWIPDEPMSPLLMAKLKGKQRRHASPKKDTSHGSSLKSDIKSTANNDEIDW